MAKPARLMSPILALLSLAAFSSPALAQGRQINLRLILEAGQTYSLRFTDRDETTYQTDGGPWVSTDQSDLEISFRVRSVDVVGIARVDVRFEHLSLRFETSNQVVEFDSSQPPEVIHESAAPYAALIGLGFQMQLSPQGVPFALQGVDEMVDTLLDRMQLPEEEKAARRLEFEQRFGEEAQREWLEMALGYLPSGYVRPGAEWETEVEQSIGFPAMFNNRFVYVGQEDGTVTLDLASEITPLESVWPTLSHDSRLTTTASGTQGGTYLVDRATGWIREANLTQETAGTVLVEGAQDTEPYTLEFVAKTESRVNGVTGQSFVEAVVDDPNRGLQELPKAEEHPDTSGQETHDEFLQRLEELGRAAEARETASEEAMAEQRVAELNAARDAVFDAYQLAIQEYSQAGQLLISQDEQVLRSANAPAAKALFEASLARLDDLVQNNQALAQEDMAVPSLGVDILRFRNLDGLRAIARIQEDHTASRVSLQRLIELGASLVAVNEEAKENPELTLTPEHQQIMSGLPSYIADAYVDLAWACFGLGDHAAAERHLAEAEKRGADRGRVGTLRLIMGG